MPLADFSVVLITRDGGATLSACLESLASFDEVVVFDNGSSDDTQEIAAGFANVSWYEGSFLGFGKTKRAAVDLARHDWVLSIDADEYLSAELAEELDRLDLSDAQVAYEVLRNNKFMGKHVRFGGWGGDWLIRAFNRKHCQFNDAPVHEQVEVPAGVRTQRLNNPLWHEAVTELNQFLSKIARYSELRRRDRRVSHLPTVLIFLRACWAFLRSYVFQLGLLAGWRGLVIAYSESIGTFFKYMKVRADRAVEKEQGEI